MWRRVKRASRGLGLRRRRRHEEAGHLERIPMPAWWAATARRRAKVSKLIARRSFQRRPRWRQRRSPALSQASRREWPVEVQRVSLTWGRGKVGEVRDCVVCLSGFGVVFLAIVDPHAGRACICRRPHENWRRRRRLAHPPREGRVNRRRRCRCRSRAGREDVRHVH